jgi:hypothetical protein
MKQVNKMKDVFRGAIFQDNTFEFNDFDGLKLEKLITCENPETKEVVIVYIKVETKEWHQFFLDAGYGFWQNYEDIDPTDEANSDDEYNYIEKGIEFGLLDKRVNKIWCEPHENNSQIIVEFETKEKLILRTIKPELFDTSSELIVIKS